MVLETPLVVQPVSGTNTITAAQWRTIADFLIRLDGVGGAADLKVTQRAAGPNMTVDVAAGSWSVTGSIPYQGTYISRSTAVEPVTIAPAPGSGTRTDLICIQVQDAQSGDGSGQMRQRLLPVLGIVGAGVPATPANAVALAKVVIPAGKASIVNADITDLRVRATAIGPDVQSGSFPLTFAAGIAAGTIAFPQPFAGVPTVVLSSIPITGNTGVVINITGATATTFGYRAAVSAGGYYTGGGTGYYIAVY